MFLVFSLIWGIARNARGDSRALESGVRGGWRRCSVGVPGLGGAGTHQQPNTCQAEREHETLNERSCTRGEGLNGKTVVEQDNKSRAEKGREGTHSSARQHCTAKHDDGDAEQQIRATYGFKAEGGWVGCAPRAGRSLGELAF